MTFRDVFLIRSSLPLLHGLAMLGYELILIGIYPYGCPVIPYGDRFSYIIDRDAVKSIRIL
jgi:hypothetical protein